MHLNPPWYGGTYVIEVAQVENGPLSAGEWSKGTGFSGRGGLELNPEGWV